VYPAPEGIHSDRQPENPRGSRGRIERQMRAVPTANSVENFTAMADDADAQILQVFRRQIRQDRLVYLVLRRTVPHQISVPAAIRPPD
jgi:hypothetical protein